MKRVHGSPVVPRQPNSGGDVAIPVSNDELDQMSGTLDAILDQLKLMNELLMDIAK